MASVHPVVPCLWFGGQAEEAARLRIGIFPNSRTTKVLQCSSAGEEIRALPAPGAWQGNLRARAAGPRRRHARQAGQAK